MYNQKQHFKHLKQHKGQFSAQLNLAVLIDAENISASFAPVIFENVQAIGNPRTARLYGNFTSPLLNGWKAPAQQFGLKSAQLFNGCQGKNASDMALVIDAMDLVHTGHYDGICIVSNDSDFTPLAIRIRDAGLHVFGFGTQQAAHMLTSVCDKYIRLVHHRQSPHTLKRPRLVA